MQLLASLLFSLLCFKSLFNQDETFPKHMALVKSKAFTIMIGNTTQLDFCALLI